MKKIIIELSCYISSYSASQSLKTNTYTTLEPSRFCSSKEAISIAAYSYPHGIKVINALEAFRSIAHQYYSPIMTQRCVHSATFFTSFSQFLPKLTKTEKVTERRTTHRPIYEN